MSDILSVWLALLGAASICGLLSFILAPNVQPPPPIRDKISALLYLVGLALALAAVLAAW